MENLVFVLVGLAVFGLFIVRPVWQSLRGRREKADLEQSAEKAEAFFKASFPELQPHLHPENVAAYVVARTGKQFAARKEWDKPPGFAAARLARYFDAPEGGGERTMLLDAAGNTLLEFVLEPKAGSLGALRVGQGKFTVRQDRGQPPRVSYWHPEREFQWKGRGKWKFTSRVADEAIDTTDRHWSDSGSSSSGSPSTTTAAAAAAGIVGLGGTFDGGGASAGWDSDERGASSGSASASGDSSFASVSSGSSSTADASDSSGSSSSTSY
ncbi:MAG: hypothetical protein IPL06_15800 [Betaproteobacteria bacterium]|nr:hypothetical protein [Betaproteobacteria bacterium]